MSCERYGIYAPLENAAKREIEAKDFASRGNAENAVPKL